MDAAIRQDKDKIIYFKCNDNGWNDTMHYKIKQQK